MRGLRFLEFAFFPAGTGFGTLAEDYLHALAPVLVNPYEFPIDLRRDVAQQHVSLRVDVECRRDQVGQRFSGDNSRSAKYPKRGNSSRL